MLEKNSNTATADRKLPVPFFEVLDQEESALRGTGRNNFSWDFAESHFKENADLKKLAEAISKLFPADEPKKFSVAHRPELVARLNELLHAERCLYRHPDFPKAGLSQEIVAMTSLKLEASEMTRLNRLLLEAAFSEHIKTISDIHLASIYRRIHAGEGSAALCFSGGGIRSATFALGVTQGLAQRGVLKHFDYLSTVSGGGYIGSWLSSWIHRSGSADKVFAALQSGRAESPMEPEPPTLSHLRKYSNYLTPKLGLFSADTWTLVATYARNLILNWLIFIPLLLAFLAFPRLHVALLHLAPPPWVVAAGFVVGGILSVWALAFSAMNRPAVAEDFKANGGQWFARRSQENFLVWCLLPLCLAAVCLTTSWAWLQHGVAPGTGGRAVNGLLVFIGGASNKVGPQLLNFCLIAGLLHFAGWVLCEFFLKRWRSGRWSVMGWEFFLALVTGAVGGIFLWLVAVKAPPITDFTTGLAWYGCLAAPAIFLLFLFAATIFIGVGCKVTSDEDREWWARMGGWMLIAVLGWTLFSALVLFGPLALVEAPKLLGAVGGLSGLFTLIVGYGSGTAASKDAKAKAGPFALILDKGLQFAAPLTLAALVVLLSLLTSWLLLVAGNKLGAELTNLVGLRPSEALSHFNAVVSEASWWLVAAFMFIAALLGWGLSRLINVNKFSLHAIYRNRLVRAYLGASNSKRNPNPFTGFDPADNLPLSDLRDPKDPSLPQRPLHIVNMALNLVTGENLAWQQRKAESFTASALHCGNYRLGYRFSKHYAVNAQGRGLSLGTAVAVSGAAASPNQGYHSSPLVALLMTFFNVRLGWWLGNPGAMGHETFHDASPRSPVLHWMKEGLGLTNSSSPYVYLSDGGHFENLGLYEMVLRRARFIVVSDAGCDPECNLEDLGNAIRKIRVDLGVKIEMHPKFQIYSRTDDAGKTGGHYCALGEIDYGTADEGGRKGILIYLKPAIIGGEPRDVYNYSRQNAAFPHEPTSDQWFSESQFESYRALGQRTIEWMFLSKSSGTPDAPLRTEVLTDLIHQAYAAAETPRPSSAEDLFSRNDSADGGRAES